MKKVLNLQGGLYSVVCNHDVEFKIVPGELGSETLKKSLSMQMLIPRSEDRTKKPEPFTIVLYITGGGWKTPQVRYRVPTMVRLAERGWLVAMAEYRGSEICNGQDAAEDVRSAVCYIRMHASEYGGSPDKIILLGDSAGAHLSMLAGYHGEEFDSPNDNLSVSAEVSGIIELFGPTDLVRSMREFDTKEMESHPVTESVKSTFAALTKTPDLDKQAELLEPLSILSRISPEAKIPPTLIAQGTEDFIVPPWHAEELYNALTNAGKDVEYYLLKGARHGDKRFYEDEMIDYYERFIQRCTEEKQ